MKWPTVVARSRGLSLALALDRVGAIVSAMNGVDTFGSQLRDALARALDDRRIKDLALALDFSLTLELKRSANARFVGNADIHTLKKALANAVRRAHSLHRTLNRYRERGLISVIDLDRSRELAGDIFDDLQALIVRLH